MSFITGNGNGLIAPPDIFPSGPTRPAFYLTRQNESGDVDISGTLFVDTIEPVSTTEPVYIRAPNELGGVQLNNSALVVEGGALPDISNLQVTISTYKPITRGLVNHTAGEDVGSLSAWGKDTSGSDVKYADVRSLVTDPRAGMTQGRMNFIVAKNSVQSTLLQIDASLNLVRTLDSAGFTSAGDISGNAALRVATTITAGGAITAGGNVVAGAVNTVQGRQMTVAETTVSGGLGGIAFTVDGNAAGRLNSDATKMQLNGSTGPSYPVEIQCNERTAIRATTDASNNIAVAIGASQAPARNVRLTNVDASGTTTYWPSLMRTTAATSSGADISFSNTATQLSTNLSFAAPYTGFYQFMGQFKATTIGTFNVGTDTITFYADISGGGLSPLVGLTHDIVDVGTGSNVEMTFSGYVSATAGEIVNMYHIDEGTFTITGGVLFGIWKWMGAGTGLGIVPL